MTWEVLHGDCRAVLLGFESDSVDAVVTDPPYELKFMGKDWDASGVAFSVGMWREVLRVLKPGGHLLAFGGTRTYHRMTCAIEDAGFEIRDSLHWMYGTGFPKSLNVSKAIDEAAGIERGHNPDTRNGPNTKQGTKGDKYSLGYSNDLKPDSGPATEAAKQWDGWGTALKPGHEPIVIARKPLEGTVAQNVLKWGTGGLNIDGCRIATTDNLNGGAYSATSTKKAEDASTFLLGTTGKDFKQPEGRWPANVLLDEAAAAELDAQSGVSKSTQGKSRGGKRGVAGGFGMQEQERGEGFGDTGGASRFFYVAKPSRKERGKDNNHPTVKPVELLRYLVRLVAQQGSLVLDPFAGSGTAGIACGLEGTRFVGIEMEAEYVALARRRISQSQKQTQPTLFREAK